MAQHGLESSLASDVLLPVALAVIMFGMGMTLTGKDFGRIARTPRSIATGLVGQWIALPLLAMFVAIVFHHVFDFSGTLVLGLLLLACVPGGPTSNLLTFLARADVALSVTLTSIVTLAGVLFVPLLFLGMTRLLFADAFVVTVPFLEMALLVLAILVVPVALGMLVRRFATSVALAAERPVRVASIVIFIGVVAGVIYANRADFWTLAAASVPAVLVLNLLALAAGLMLGRAARLPVDQRRTLAFEIGFQNGTLGITLAVLQLGSPQAAIVPGFYGLVMFLTGGALAWWWGREKSIRQGRIQDLDTRDPVPFCAPLVALEETPPAPEA